MPAATLDVLITTPSQILFQGKAQSVTVPGEQGVFEMLPLHRSLVSRLIEGSMMVDEQVFSIRRGVLRVADDVVTAVVELP